MADYQLKLFSPHDVYDSPEGVIPHWDDFPTRFLARKSRASDRVAVVKTRRMAMASMLFVPGFCIVVRAAQVFVSSSCLDVSREQVPSSSGNRTIGQPILPGRQY